MKLIEDNYSTYVLRHPDGSLIKIAKENISPDLKVKILAMADGGVVPDKGFIPIRDMPMTPPEEVVPIGVLPTTPPEAKFTGVTRATKEEQMQPATFAPGTADVYKTAVDQPRPVRQSPVQPYVPEQAPGGAEEAPISPLDFPMEAASLAGAGVKIGAKTALRGAMAGREALYKAVPRLASEVGAIGGRKVEPRLNPLGMYSKMEQTISEKMGGSATPDQILGMLRDVKPEEIQYSGLNDFLAGKNKVSKQEILDFVKANELQIQEVVKTQSQYADPRLDRTKYSQYTLPGGENYREKLYTLPEKSAVNNVKYQKNPEGEWDVLNENGRVIFTGTREQEAKDYINELNIVRNRDLKTNKENYQSYHFNEPNILAHTRLNDRVDAEGRKHLFAEEIQSDWHQAGREKGYQGSQTKISKLPEGYKVEEYKPTLKFGEGEGQLETYWTVTSPEGRKLLTGMPSKDEAVSRAIDKINRENVSDKVPDAPMKKTWHEFVSKNILVDAAKGGYDNVSWTTGAQQADRYSLAKYVHEIEYTKNPNGTYDLAIGMKDDTGKTLSNLTEKDLEAHLGKEVANKIISNEGKKYRGHEGKTLENVDLELGGEGMKGFYDKIIPDYMSKLGKKYGVKPEYTELATAAQNYDMNKFAEWAKRERGIDIDLLTEMGEISDVAKLEREYKTKVLPKVPKKEKVWTMKITPEMRKDILEKGLPLYSVGGAVAGGMLGNNEAEAKDMNYKLLENNKDHYVMRHPDGSSFKVAKKGLNPEIMKKIEGYADFVQRAEGQIPGVDMPEQTASTMPEQPKEPDFAQMVQESPKTQQDIYKEKIGQATGDIYRGLESTYGARLGMIPEEYTPEKIRTMAEERVLGTSEREALKAKNQEFLNKEEEQQKLNETLAYNQRAAKVGMPLRPLPGQKQELPLEAQTKQMAQPEQLQPQPQVVPAADPFALYEKGIRGESAAKAEFAKQEAETYKKLQEDVTNGNKVFNDKLAKGYENLDAFQKHLQTKEVDPNRYWSNAGVANKISASIALILGGIGGALTKTDNAALKIIDKTIDNDIEAQKKNIDQGNNLYKMNLERLKDDKEAYAMTKAQMIQLAELQLKQQLSRASSKEAIAQGEINLGKLQLAKQEYLKQTALDTVIKQAQTNPQLLTPEIIQRLPEKDRELVVPGYGFAISKAGAEKIRTELLPQKDTSVQMIDDLINIRKKYGREITDREVVARAKALKTFIDGNMRLFVVGPGAVTPDERKIIDNVIADPTKVLSTDAGTIASLTGLKEGIERSFNNQAKANGLLVPQAQAQGQQPVRGADGKFYIQQGRYMIPVNK